MARIKIPDYFSDDQRKTADRFVTMTKGIPANVVAKALNSLTPGNDWMGCSKSDMIEFMALDNKRGRGIDLDVLEKRLPTKD